MVMSHMLYRTDQSSQTIIITNPNNNLTCFMLTPTLHLLYTIDCENKILSRAKTHFRDLLLAAVTNSKLRPANLRFSTSGFRRLFLISTLRFSWFGDGSG